MAVNTGMVRENPQDVERAKRQDASIGGPTRREQMSGQTYTPQAPGSTDLFDVFSGAASQNGAELYQQPPAPKQSYFAGTPWAQQYDPNLGNWSTNPVNFMYGRDPRAADQSASMLRSLGQGYFSNLSDAFVGTSAEAGLAGQRGVQQRADQLARFGTQTGGSLMELSQYATQNALDSAQQLNTIGRSADAAGQLLGADVATTGMGLGQRMMNLGGQLGGDLQQTGGALFDVSAASMARPDLRTDFRSAQHAIGGAQGLAGSLAALEATEGPSAAQAQLQLATNQAMASQLALARSGRGLGGGAAAMSEAQRNAAAIQSQAAAQSAALRAQEQAAWRQRQAANLGAAAGVGLQSGQQLAGMSQFATDAGIRQQALRDQTALGFAQSGLAAQQAGAGLALGSLESGAQTALGAQQAGAGLQMQGLGMRADLAGQAGALGLQGYQAGADIYGRGAGLATDAQMQGAQLYGIGTELGLAGLAQGADIYSQGFRDQLAAEQLVNQIRTQEMEGGLAFEDAITRRYAAQVGGLSAEAEARAQRDAAAANAWATGLSSLALFL